MKVNEQSMVLFIMLYAGWKSFPMVLFIMLYKIALTFESVVQ